MIKYYETNLRILEKAIESIDIFQYEKLLEECCKTLWRGNKIITSGLGKNVPICEKFVGTMNSYGLSAGFLHTNTAVHGDLGIVKPGDLVLLLSKSGNTEETLVLAHYLQKKDCRVWALTFGENARVCDLVNETFFMQLEHEGDQWDIVPNNSTTAYLIVLQGMAIELSKRFGVDKDSFGCNHPGGSIGKRLGMDVK